MFFFAICNVVQVLLFLQTRVFLIDYLLVWLLLLHNLSSFIKLLHSYERILTLFLWLFLKLLKQTWIFLHQHLHSLQFLIVQQIIFAELLLNQHSILFVDFNKLLLVNNDFWWNHNPTKFCGIIFILICFNFLISLYCFISESISLL